MNAPSHIWKPHAVYCFNCIMYSLLSNWPPCIIWWPLALFKAFTWSVCYPSVCRLSHLLCVPSPWTPFSLTSLSVHGHPLVHWIPGKCPRVGSVFLHPFCVFVNRIIYIQSWLLSSKDLVLPFCCFVNYLLFLSFIFLFQWFSLVGVLFLNFIVVPTMSFCFMITKRLLNFFL